MSFASLSRHTTLKKNYNQPFGRCWILETANQRILLFFELLLLPASMFHFAYVSVRLAETNTPYFFPCRDDPVPYYNACTNASCQKKVTFANGAWFCEKCQDAFPSCTQRLVTVSLPYPYLPSFVVRYMLNLLMADSTGGSWFSTFSDSATTIIGCEAPELHQVKTIDQGE
jgi:hypothetical protein